MNYDEIILPAWAGATPVIVAPQLEFVVVAREPYRPAAVGWPVVALPGNAAAYETPDGLLRGAPIYYEDDWLFRLDAAAGCTVYGTGTAVKIAAVRRTGRKIYYDVSRIAPGRNAEGGRIMFEIASGRALAGSAGVPAERLEYWSRFILPVGLLRECFPRT